MLQLMKSLPFLTVVMYGVGQKKSTFPRQSTTAVQEHFHIDFIFQQDGAPSHQSKPYSSWYIAR